MGQRKLRLFVSAMENHYDPNGVAPSALALMERLDQAGYAVSWTKNFRGYPTILDDIEASDALLVIMDETWSSSTWMQIEASHAMGVGELHGRRNPKPIATFVYPLTQRRVWLTHLPASEAHLATILDIDVDKAVTTINSKMATA